MPVNIERQAASETKIDALWKHIFGNGQPGLEAKLTGKLGEVRGELKSHIETVERHTEKNIEEGDGLVLNELREKHRENVTAREEDKKELKEEQKVLGKKIDRLTIVQATLAGALLAIKALEDFGVIHIAGGK